MIVCHVLVGSCKDAIDSIGKESIRCGIVYRLGVMRS